MRLCKTRSLAWGIGLLLAGTVHAEGVSSIQIGASYTRANIMVDGQSSFDGNLGGVQGIYEYKACNGFYGGVRAALKEGKTEKSHADRKLAYADVQGRVGYTYAPYCTDWTVTFFSGFGYRYLKHRLRQSHEHIQFKYNEFYVPVGFLTEYFFNACWSFGFNCVWMPQVFPTVEIVPLKGAHWDLKNTIGNVLVELPLTYFFQGNSCYSLILKPFYERWNDGKSTAKFNGQKLGLPKNSYNFWGVEFNFAFAF
jgi:hypothetical protein